MSRLVGDQRRSLAGLVWCGGSALDGVPQAVISLSSVVSSFTGYCTAFSLATGMRQSRIGVPRVFLLIGVASLLHAKAIGTPLTVGCN